MRAIVDLTLWSSTRHFSLPSSGTRSLMFRFGDSLLGWTVASIETKDFAPGSAHRDATLDLWDDVDVSVGAGTSFTVWYGGDVGEGTVTALAPDA